MANDGGARGASRRMPVMPEKVDGADRGVAERRRGSLEAEGMRHGRHGQGAGPCY